MKLIVGLGNPGEKYKGTRHNIGFEAIDFIAKEFQVDNFKKKYQGEISFFEWQGEKVALLKPLTYMNLSGNSIQEVVKFYKLDPREDLIVIYDDMDLDLARIKIKRKGRAGGHNGIKSIISHLGEDFIRIKCGIGKPEKKEDVINYVLGKFSKGEIEAVEEILIKNLEISKALLNTINVEKVISLYNRK